MRKGGTDKAPTKSEPNMTDESATESDAELIRDALAGRRLAGERLIERHRRSVLALAFRVLGNSDDAQDVAQEVLMYAYQRLSDVRDPDRFGGWLRQVTLTISADYRRRRGTRRLGEPMTCADEAGARETFAESLTTREAVSHLSGDLRTTLLLRYVGGWSVNEVAVITNAPINTVRSRLMAGKRSLRATLGEAFGPAPDRTVFTNRSVSTRGKTMTTDNHDLTENHIALIQKLFPGAEPLSVKYQPELWQPFSPRVRLRLAGGAETTVDFRGDLSPARIPLLSLLERLDIPGPRILAGRETPEGYLTLCEKARGENLTLWALGGTPHRIRLATERAIEGIDRLQGVTDALIADPVGSKIPRRTLSDEVAILTDDSLWAADSWLAEEGKSRRDWLSDPWFAAAVARVRDAARDITTPLVYTHYMQFFPQNYRIAPGTAPTDEPLGYPGDPHYQQNPLVEFVFPFGHFGDPVLGLAMVWVQDCYPFVHTGFVEQFLWRRGVTRREFAPRLAIKAMQMVARELPLARPAEGGGYWDSLRGWAEQGLAWM